MKITFHKRSSTTMVYRHVFETMNCPYSIRDGFLGNTFLFLGGSGQEGLIVHFPFQPSNNLLKPLDTWGSISNPFKLLELVWVPWERLGSVMMSVVSGSCFI